MELTLWVTLFSWFILGIVAQVVEDKPEISFAPAPLVASSSSSGSCGQTRFPPGLGRIVNGNAAHRGNFPWLAAFVHKTHRQYCAGTVLSASWVMTAAHCVVGSLTLRDVLANVSVIVGTLDLANVSQTNTYAISQAVLYPGYDPTGWKNDLAMVKLSRPIPNFNDDVRPSCLPRRSLEDLLKASNQSCFLAGWGYLSEKPGVSVFTPPSGAPNARLTNATRLGSGSDKLLFARLNQVPLKVCQETYYTQGMRLQGKPEYVTDGMVCAASGHMNQQANPQGSCLGDSGGGLFCQEEDRSWVVYGIASWSGGCARKDLPSIFTSVFKLRSFVDRIMSFRLPG